MSDGNSNLDLMIVMTTESNLSRASELATAILEQGLAACVSLREVESHYLWKRKISVDREVQLLIKTKKELVEMVISSIKKLHGYEIPELIYCPASATKDYCDWISCSAKSSLPKEIL